MVNSKKVTERELALNSMEMEDTTKANGLKSLGATSLQPLLCNPLCTHFTSNRVGAIWVEFVFSAFLVRWIWVEFENYTPKRIEFGSNFY